METERREGIGNAFLEELLRWHQSPRSAWVWMAVPPLLFVFLGSIRFVDRSLLRSLSGEDGFFEWVQAAAFLVAAVSSLLSARLLLRRARTLPAALFALLGLALVFALGEELAWGQRILGFSTPGSLAEMNEKQEVSLHNIESVTQWFTLAKIVIGLYGGLGAFALHWLRRRRSVDAIELFVVPTFLVSPFLIVMGMRLLRLTLLRHTVPMGYSELEELWLAIGMAAFAVHVIHRLRREEP